MVKKLAALVLLVGCYNGVVDLGLTKPTQPVRQFAPAHISDTDVPQFPLSSPVTITITDAAGHFLPETTLVYVRYKATDYTCHIIRGDCVVNLPVDMNSAFSFQLWLDGQDEAHHALVAYQPVVVSGGKRRIAPH